MCSQAQGRGGRPRQNYAQTKLTPYPESAVWLGAAGPSWHVAGHAGHPRTLWFRPPDPRSISPSNSAGHTRALVSCYWFMGCELGVTGKMPLYPPAIHMLFLCQRL